MPTPRRRWRTHRHPPDARRPDRRGAARRDRDRGAATVELAILWPAILFMVFGAVQVAAYFTARTVALSAAQVAVSTERRYNATHGDGLARAESFLVESGDWLVCPRPCVTVDYRTDQEVSVTVTGEALSIVPGVRWPISQTAHGTVERFTSSQAGSAP